MASKEGKQWIVAWTGLDGVLAATMARMTDEESAALEDALAKADIRYTDIVFFEPEKTMPFRELAALLRERFDIKIGPKEWRPG